MTVTTAAIELIDAPSTPQVRRDQWGRYKVLAPNGKKPTGYARATTIAKATDDESNLLAWGCRMTALGLASRADLLAKVRTASADDRKTLNDLCDKAKEAGGATVRRDLGTELHRIIELANTDPTYTPPAAYAADVAAVHAELAAHGFTVVAGMSERMVVMDEHGIAGTFDLILERNGVQYIADIKTGSSVAYGSVSWAIQLAIYANADALYTQGASPDGSDDVREPMPAVDKSTAIIIHVQPESGVCDLHELDIAAGFDALSVALDVRRVRKLKPLTKIPSAASLSADGEAVEQEAAPPAPAPAEASLGGAGSPAEAGNIDNVDTRRAWLQERVGVIVADPDRRKTLSRNWPSGMPTLKASTDHSAAELGLISLVLDDIESQYGLGFAPTDPALTTPTPQAAPTPPPPTAWVQPDEGPWMSEADGDAIRAAAARLAVGDQSQVKRWMNDGDAFHRPWGATGGQHGTMSQRRFEIIRAALQLAPLTDDDARHLIGLALREELQPATRTGTALGCLTIEQATELHDLAAGIAAGRALTISDDGTPLLKAVA